MAYKIQARDDKLAQLQMEKLELEVQKLRADIAVAKQSDARTSITGSEK